MADLDGVPEVSEQRYEGPQRNHYLLWADSYTVPTDEFVRFCNICGEREDSPFRGEWCDPDPYGQPDYKHIWGRPERMFKRLYYDPVENRVGVPTDGGTAAPEPRLGIIPTIR